MKPKIKPGNGWSHLFEDNEVGSYANSSKNVLNNPIFPVTTIPVTILPTADYRRLLRDAKELADFKRGE